MHFLVIKGDSGTGNYVAAAMLTNKITWQLIVDDVADDVVVDWTMT